MYKCYVYCWLNKINKKRYIGCGQNNRAFFHIYDSHKKSPRSLIARAIKKYGVENFDLIVLEEGLLKNEVQIRERWYIAKWQTNITREYKSGEFGVGYNMTDGGNGGHKLTKETKEKLTNKKSIETRKKMSEGAKKSWGDAKRKEARLLKRNTLEHKISHSEASKRNWNSERKEKHSKRMSNEKHFNAKVTWDLVDELRKKYDLGECTITSLSKEYTFISYSTIHKIIMRLSWNKRG